MRELLPALSRWWWRDQKFVLATLVAVRGSAPRLPGAAMAVGQSGDVVGSVSGGCIEASIYELAQEVMESGRPVLESFGIADDDALQVGLSCGGTMDILLRLVDQDMSPWFGILAEAVQRGEPVALATLVDQSEMGGRELAVWRETAAGSFGNAGLDAAVIEDARGLLAQGTTGLRHYGSRGESRREEVAVLIQTFAPPPRMLIFGAVDFAEALTRIGSFLGYRVTVCDARQTFATAERFPVADEVVCQWPHRYLATTSVDERTVIAALTHDVKFDVPLLQVALETPAAYIGAMGSRRTHDLRLRQLRAAGVTDDQLERIKAPIGLDLGAQTPEETAVSIAAEVIGSRFGGSGVPLKDLMGSIHRELAWRT